MCDTRELAARKLKGEVDENERETALLTAADMEDLWNEEKSKFNLASRSTGLLSSIYE